MNRMIKVHEYLDLDTSVIRISSIIINELKNQGSMKYDELYNRVINNVGDRARTVFIYALDFLYLFDKVIYYSDFDVLELRK